MKVRYLLVTASLLAMAANGSALAQERIETRSWHAEGARAETGGWHSGAPVRYHEHSFERWKDGHWFHGPHQGRNGYWWVVDGIYYYYPEPVLPYPDPYTPPMVVQETVQVVPATPQYWYCSNPPGYYPYVPRCYAPWQGVKATTVPEPTVQSAAPIAPQPRPQATVSNAPQRDEDYRQLNALSDEFSAIDLNGTGAFSRLKKLDNQIVAFRKTLLDRSYNAMGILRDTENLKERVDKERSRVRPRKAAASAPASAPAPAPTPAPMIGTPP
jgi:hypothetical protein